MNIMNHTEENQTKHASKIDIYTPSMQQTSATVSALFLCELGLLANRTETSTNFAAAFSIP